MIDLECSEALGGYEMAAPGKGYEIPIWASVRERLCPRVVRRDDHWDWPYVQGTGQPSAVSESSQSVAQVALQGLTCEKKTESILVKAADLYSK